MIRLPFYLTMFNLILACGAPQLDNPTVTPVDNPRTDTQTAPEIDPELLEAVQQWKEDCYTFSALHCGSLFNRIDSIRLVDGYAKDDDATTIGQCKLQTYALIVVRREVTIKRSLLKSPVTLRAVLAHEFGHCIFLRNHVEDDENLMSPYILPQKVLDEHLPAMLQEFYRQIQANELPKIGAFE